MSDAEIRAAMMIVGFALKGAAEDGGGSVDDAQNVIEASLSLIGVCKRSLGMEEASSEA